MTDTAQALPAETGRLADIEAAADAFKAFTTGEPIPERIRDEHGRFASASEPEQEISDEAEVDTEAEAESDADHEGAEEAAEEAQPDPIDMPTSWSKEDADLWSALPPEAQAKIAEREGERDRAVNLKFQEAANVKKAHEADLAEANANRDSYAQAIDTVLSLVNPQRPDPRQYGLGTGNYDRDSYDMALVQYEQSVGIIQNLQQQRQAIAAQQSEEEGRRLKATIDAIEETARPAFLADVPDLSDPQKAGPLMNEIIQYAVGKGIPVETFTGENAQNITSAELHIAWEAMQYRKIMAARSTVKATPPPAKATPTAKPGVAISRSASRTATLNKAQSRLAKEGSIEAGAAVFKQLFG